MLRELFRYALLIITGLIVGFIIATSINSCNVAHTAQRNDTGHNFTIDVLKRKEIIKVLDEAWRRCGNGELRTEVVVLIARDLNGNFIASIPENKTNEYRMFTFTWDNGIVAVVHTHPNYTDSKPHGADLILADKKHVPVFTITMRGMYVYDPSTKQTSMICRNLEWLIWSTEYLLVTK